MPQARLDTFRQHALRVHEGVASMLGTDTELAEDAIHDLRVATKELRALWQLLKPLLDDPRAEQAIADLGKAAATLSAARDRHASRETLKHLCQRQRGKHAQKALGRALYLLQTTGSEKSTGTVASRQLRANWAEDYQRWATLDAEIDADELFSSGYGRLYRKAHRLHARASNNNDTRLWHKLRKWVKYLALALPLAGAGPGLEAMYADFRRLADRLGRLHDLEKLLLDLTALEWPADDNEHASRVRELLRHEIHAAVEDCGTMANVVFARKPRRFIHMLKATAGTQKL